MLSSYLLYIGMAKPAVAPNLHLFFSSPTEIPLRRRHAQPTSGDPTHRLNASQTQNMPPLKCRNLSQNHHELAIPLRFKSTNKTSNQQPDIEN